LRATKGFGASIRENGNMPAASTHGLIRPDQKRKGDTR